MTQPTLYLVAFVITTMLSWWPGNWLVWNIWKLIAFAEGVPRGALSPLVKSVGTLERILYVMGVMGHHYEIIAGWLVLKAFFGFMGRDEAGGEAAPGVDTSARPKEPSGHVVLLRRYNGLLIGNALSLLIGISLGMTANLIIRWGTGVQLDWALYGGRIGTPIPPVIDRIVLASNIASSVLAILAGVAWIQSATAFVPAPAGHGLGAVLDGDIYDVDKKRGPFDVLKTMKLQSRWNRCAAWLAAAVAAFQATAVLLPLVQMH